MAHSQHFLAVDLGASNGRVFLGRLNDAQLSLEEIHRFANDPVWLMGHQHWNVLSLWAGIQQALQSYAVRFQQPLAGISVDTWGVDFALLDAQGRLLANPYHYRDPRNNGMVDKVQERLSKESIYATTGVQFMQINSLYQLYGMVLRDDPLLETAQRLLFMPDLFNYWLSGEAICEYTIASTSQMLDANSRSWASSMLDSLGIPRDILLPLTPPGNVIAPMRRELANALQLKHQPPIITSGSHDTANAVAAIADLDEHSLYISSGTWSLVGIEVAEPVITPQALEHNFTNEGGVAGRIRLLKNVAGLWLLQESRRQWRRQGQDYSWEALLQRAAQAPAFRSLINPDAPDFLNPADMPAAIAAYCQRHGQAVPEDVGQVVRCCLESLALRYRQVVEALEQLSGQPLQHIYVVGGGSNNALLCQFTADACQRPVIAGPVEATVFGNILMQAIATGDIADLAAGRRLLANAYQRQHFEPSNSEAWQAANKRFQQVAGGNASGLD